MKRFAQMMATREEIVAEFVFQGSVNYLDPKFRELVRDLSLGGCDVRTHGNGQSAIVIDGGSDWTVRHSGNVARLIRRHHESMWQDVTTENETLSFN